MTQRMVSAHTPAEDRTPADWHTREAEEHDAYGTPWTQEYERVTPEDSTLIAGVPSEEVTLSLAQGWAVDKLVAEACAAYRCRKHAPHLMESDELPQE